MNYENFVHNDNATLIDQEISEHQIKFISNNQVVNNFCDIIREELHKVELSKRAIVFDCE